ncbi:unnamed protein product [Brassica oleracea var. botrytis]
MVAWVKYITSLLSSIIKIISGFNLLYLQLLKLYPVSIHSLRFPFDRNKTLFFCHKRR